MFRAHSHPSIAVLIGSDLRALDQFVDRLDNLFVDGQLYDAYISTDGKSIACVNQHRLLKQRQFVRWIGETPDTSSAIRKAFGPLDPRIKYHHLHQWWRLRDAWNAMERHEKRRGEQYVRVVRLRSDMRIPAPFSLAPSWVPGLDGADAERSLVMRGDWIFWGRREAMRTAIEYVDALPHMHALGQRAYLPLPWRHMLAIGSRGLAAGLWNWIRFPKVSAAVPFGFSAAEIGNLQAALEHIRTNLGALEAFEASGHSMRLRPHDSLSARDGWWKWDLIPDNEKFFFYHVLNRSLVREKAPKEPDERNFQKNRNLLIEFAVMSPP